ncbi:MAG: hypothetical protein WDM79_02645 [Terricaulis sp.]
MSAARCSGDMRRCRMKDEASVKEAPKPTMLWKVCDGSTLDHRARRRVVAERHIILRGEQLGLIAGGEPHFGDIGAAAASAERRAHQRGRDKAQSLGHVVPPGRLGRLLVLGLFFPS